MDTAGLFHPSSTGGSRSLREQDLPLLCASCCSVPSLAFRSSAAPVSRGSPRAVSSGAASSRLPEHPQRYGTEVEESVLPRCCPSSSGELTWLGCAWIYTLVTCLPSRWLAVQVAAVPEEFVPGYSGERACLSRAQLLACVCGA